MAEVEPEPQRASRAAGAEWVRASVRRAYVVTVTRWLRFFVPSVAVFAGVLVTGIGWLLPLAIVAFALLVYTGMVLWARLSLLGRCSRVLRAYPEAEFRAPVEKVELQRSEKRYVLRLGGGAGAESPEQRATVFGGGLRWPEGIADGVWFRGDDAFGGVAVVPGTGDVLFMQPRNWDSAERFRRAAGPAREATARQAGTDRPVPARW